MLDIQRILNPTDFSDCARQTLKHALFLADQFDAELVMYHAVVLHADDPHHPDSHFPGTDQLAEHLHELASSEMSRLIEDEDEVNIRQVRERGFSAAAMICEYAEANDTDLIVIGTHGRRGVRHLLLGSVAEEVVRLAPCPVMTLRQLDDRPIDAIEKVLVPVDFSDHSAAVVSYGKELAAVYGAGIQLLHVVERYPHPHVYAPMALPPEDNLAEIQERVDEAMEKLVGEAPGPDVAYEKHIGGGSPGAEIAAFAEREATDLIVIATHGLTGLEHVLVGSTTERVVRSAACPVLTVKSFGKSLIAGDDG